MIVIKSPDFHAELPEMFLWNYIDSPKLASLAEELVRKIHRSFNKDPERIEVPGLRAALVAIAEIADV